MHRPRPERSVSRDRSGFGSDQRWARPKRDLQDGKDENNPCRSRGQSVTSLWLKLWLQNRSAPLSNRIKVTIGFGFHRGKYLSINNFTFQ